MKKIMITLLTGAMTIGFLGACGDNHEEDPLLNDGGIEDNNGFGNDDNNDDL